MTPEGKQIHEVGDPCSEKVKGWKGTTVGRGPPMDPRITVTLGEKRVEGPQERRNDVTLGCDNRAAGHSFDKSPGGHKRGTPHGGRAW